MSAYNKAIVVESAKAFAQSEIMGDGAVSATAEQLGETPTFVHWEIVRGDFTIAYQAAKKCNTLAADKGWERIAKRMCEAYGLGKPKSEAKVSVDKQVKREAVKLEASKLVESAGITENSTAEEILAVAGKSTGAKQAALVQAAVVKSKADAKADSVAFTALKAETCKAVKSADSVTIAKIRKILGLK
jgi:hypothetical protein